MVVRFFPSEEEREGRGSRSGTERSERESSRSPRPKRASGVAPVAYLPGAAPSERAQAAFAAVQAVAAADAETAESGPGDRASAKAREKAGKRATNVSLHQLARRGMSRWELEQVLRKREVDDTVAQAELDRLASVGLLDDEALAVSLVYAARARKGQGRQAIERELHRRHIAADAIAAALVDYDQEEELERAIEVAVKRVSQMTGLDDQTAERRLYGYMQRRGYSGETIGIAVGDAMRSRHGD
ncbi:MAG: recombination regulator RecX [Microbacteriaceae bacterium]|nr:recombination regulator RecX [Microbacteriaceae bacterium]MCL2796300.1 recombination regulator RecX [Microbacteriaceae bacterium]